MLSRSPPADSLDPPDARELDRIRAVLEARLGVDAGAPAGRVGHYLLLDRLGAGARAVVHRAYDERVSRLVALALLHPERDSAIVHAELLEAMVALSRVTSMHVATVFELGEHDGRAFVAMEPVRGESLRGWQARRRPRWRELVDAYRRVARGLADVEEAGLVLATASARIDVRGGVKLMPLGVARGGEVGAARRGLCAALHEALLATPGEVPAWLRGVIERELAEDPAAPWPSMRALADALAGPVP